MTLIIDDRACQRAAFVRQHCGETAPEPVRASSDAGFRSYWRSQLSAMHSVIVMDAPPGLEDVRPWLERQALFHSHGVRVPQVLATDIPNGLLLLEDLGGPTLLQTLHADSADRWFQRALTQLLNIQKIPPPDAFPAYDAAMVRRELGLFDEWFLGRHLGLALSAKEQQDLHAVFDQLVVLFLDQPCGLVHRDFMPRNLMPLDNEVAVLDFQDAVSGPLAYDAICLFKDAFLSWPEARVFGWLQQYHQQACAAGLPLPEWETFQHHANWIGIQRHLKVLGIFARLHHRDNKPHYLEDAPRFIAYLLQVLPQYPALTALHTLLLQHVVPRIPPLTLPQ